MEQAVRGLSDLVVAVEGWLIDDDSELGPVSVGDTIRNYVGIWSRTWEFASDAHPSVTWIGGQLSRVTGRVDRASGVFGGFDMLCGDARFWMFTGPHDPGPPTGLVPAIEAPPPDSWVTVEGRLYVRPWYEVTDGAGMTERDMGLESGWPLSCDWRVLSVDQGPMHSTLHLSAVSRSARE